MTQTYFLSLALSALRWYLGTGVFDRVVTLVKQLIGDSSKSGAEKRAYVMDFAESELKLIGQEYIVKAIVELTLAKCKA